MDHDTRSTIRQAAGGLEMGGEAALRVRRLPFSRSPTELFLAVEERYEHAYLLESMAGPRKLAQFSFVGFSPRMTITAKNGAATLRSESSGDVRVDADDPVQVVKEALGGRRDPGRFRLMGGAVGYVSYDAVRHWEKLPATAADDLRFPDVEVGVYDDGVVYDHEAGEVYYYHRGEDRSQELSELAKRSGDPPALSSTSPEVNIPQEQFEESVVKAKAYIASGDIFQVVLSKRFAFRVDGDLAAFYLALREVNPSPYMYYLKMGDRRIVGSSPEMLVRVDRGAVETYPIAGTRPRVEDQAQNRALAEELLADPKERAEHVMLVDLARNDLGRVSRFGSVRVPEFMEVYEYSHVQHIVSRVVGELNGGRDGYDALRAVFPAGTVSGAPKVRAMEIIEECEPTRRGPYAGAVGYFSYDGNADFAITIRTLVADGDRCYIQAGAGIVADSVPEREWVETEHKARALFRALELAEGRR